MKVFTALLFLFSSPLLFSQEVTTLRIDPTYARGAKVSEVFDSVKIIPLETTKESLFGKIDQLAVTPKYFIILDNSSTRSILIFDRSGKFHAKFKAKKLSSEEKKKNPYGDYMFGFHLNPFTQQIEVRVINSPNTFCYDFNGKKIAEEKKKLTYSDYYLFAKNNIAYYNYAAYKNAKDSINHEIFLADSDKVISEYLPYNQRTTNNEILGTNHSAFYRTGNDTVALFLRAYDYMVYEVTPHNFHTRFKFIFPMANTLPKNFRSDSSFNKNVIKFLQDNKNIIYNVGYTYLLNNNLFFNTRTFGGLNGHDSFIYNLKSGNLYSVNHLAPDSTTAFLPVTDEGFWYDFSNSNFLTSDGKSLYTSYASLVMFNAREATKDRHPKYNAVLRKYFDTQDRKSNPVIIQVTPKQNL